MLQSLPNITAPHQAHKAAGEPCSIHVLWKKAGVFLGGLCVLAAVFIPGTRFMKAPLKQTESLHAKKTRTIQRSSKRGVSMSSTCQIFHIDITMPTIDGDADHPVS